MQASGVCLCLLSRSILSIDYYAVRLVLKQLPAKVEVCMCVCFQSQLEQYLTTEAKYPNLFAVRTSVPRYAYICYSERYLRVCLL